ncbi:MAG: methyltransferase domain-containing protein [Bacteroidales bacterium]|nr:methyltransferase domain-containing protein [Bacteroidales bacterium]
MTKLETKVANEIEHGKKLSEKAEDIWGWTSPAGQVRAQRRANYFINLANLNAQSKVLEIGCGTGIFTNKVYEMTKAQITAIDISEDLLTQAKEKLPKVNFKIEDAMALSFKDNSFDVVYGSSILHHLDFEKSLTEIIRVLKPKGKLIFAEPNMINPQIFIQKNIPVIKKWMGDSPDETAIVRWHFKKLMQKTGFQKIKIFPYDFLHPSVPKILIPFVKKTGEIGEKIPVLKEIAGSVIIYGEKPKN